ARAGDAEARGFERLQIRPCHRRSRSGDHRANRVEEGAPPPRRRQGRRAAAGAATIPLCTRPVRAQETPWSRRSGADRADSSKGSMMIRRRTKKEEEKELADREQLRRAWVRWHKEQLETALDGMDGDIMRRLMDELKDLRSARTLVDFIAH